MYHLDHVIATRSKKTIYRDGDCCIKRFEAGYSKADILRRASRKRASAFPNFSTWK